MIWGDISGEYQSVSQGPGDGLRSRDGGSQGAGGRGLHDATGGSMFDILRYLIPINMLDKDLIFNVGSSAPDKYSILDTSALVGSRGHAGSSHE